MKNEILSIFEYMEKEKGINRKDVIEIIKKSIYKGINQEKKIGDDNSRFKKNFKIEICPYTGSLNAWNDLKVVSKVYNPSYEIHIKDAKFLDSSIKVGMNIKKEIKNQLLTYLGRISAQITRKELYKIIKEKEKEKIVSFFKTRIGQLVTGTIQYKGKYGVIVEIDQTEAKIPFEECIPGESYARGKQIKCLLLDIYNNLGNVELILSRSHSRLVSCLFKLEVSELSENIITIKKIARIPGYKTKILVDTKDILIDPIGSIVGIRGSRIRNVMRELNGERIEVIRYTKNLEFLIQEIIKPVKLNNLKIDEDSKSVSIEVPKKDLPIIIGKRGKNNKLNSQLIGYKINILESPLSL
jgi:N utilization substance protein A